MSISEAEYQVILRNLSRSGKKLPDEPASDEPERKSKYNSRKIKIDGITFASQKEANFYCELKLLLKAGEIDGFCMQARFVITDGNDKTKATEYVTDFIIFYPDKTYEIVDVKGMQTEVFKLKMKSFRERYPNLKVELK